MKTERRHELEKNSLADWLANAVLWCEENVRLLAGVVVGAMILGVVFFVLSNRKQEREAQAWNEYFSAKSAKPVNSVGLESLAKTDGDLYAGKLADLNLADIALNQGLELIGTDRVQGEKHLTDAKKYYTQIRAAGDEHLQERAELGLARYYETMGLIDEAKTEYQKLIKRDGGLYVEFAKQKHAYLEKRATTDFVKFFREQKPVPKKSDAGFLDPNNLNTLPKSPPGETGSTAPAASATPSPSASASGTAAPAATPTATAAPTPSASPSATPAATPVASPSATPAAKPSASPSASIK